MNLEKQDLPEWIYEFANSIDGCWIYHSPCESFNFKADFDSEDEVWYINIAPVYQEIYGGENDGKKVWSAFTFDLFTFFKLPNIQVQSLIVSSDHKEANDWAKMTLAGQYKKHLFCLDVFLKPPQETQVEEIIDVLHEKIRKANYIKDENE